MIESSRNLKICIFVNFDNVANEDIEEIAILLMKGKDVIRGRILGKNIDETDNELLEKIFTEETDVNMFNPETLKLGIRTLDTSDHDIVASEIYGYLETLKGVIMRVDNSDASDDQYVIYNDNSDTVSNFYDKLRDYVIDQDDTLYPTSFKTIYPELDIKSIFAINGYKEIMYIESSAISNAAFVGVAFDFSLGYR